MWPTLQPSFDSTYSPCQSTPPHSVGHGTTLDSQPCQGIRACILRTVYLYKHFHSLSGSIAPEANHPKERISGQYSAHISTQVQVGESMVGRACGANPDFPLAVLQ